MRQVLDRKSNVGWDHWISADFRNRIAEFLGIANTILTTKFDQNCFLFTLILMLLFKNGNFFLHNLMKYIDNVIDTTQKLRSFSIL